MLVKYCGSGQMAWSGRTLKAQNMLVFSTVFALFALFVLKLENRVVTVVFPQVLYFISLFHPPVSPFFIPSISHKTRSQVWPVSVWMSFTGYITGKQWKLNPTPCVWEIMRANLHYPASPWNLCQLASRWGTSQSRSHELVSDLLITIIIFKKKKKKNSLAIYCFSSVTLGLEFCISRCLFSPHVPPALFKAGGL